MISASGVRLGRAGIGGPRRGGRASALLIATLLFASGAAFAGDNDPPARVARLAYLGGNVSFVPAGEDQWSQATLNRPLTAGDRLSTDRDGRIAMELGGAELRLDGGTTLNVAALDDRNAQFEIGSGSAELHLRSTANGESYEIDTPTLAFVSNEPGDYRIDVGDDGTTVRLIEGRGTVYGESNASYAVQARQSYRFPNSQLTGVTGEPLEGEDDFDQFNLARDERDQGRYREYVSPDVVGAADLDSYGEWDDVPEYGHVWYPAEVAPDWAPYRYGHWAWIDPWGWNWVDDAPWGFAPFHYGRWAYVGSRWGWVPGPVAVRPVYSPALVAFVGGAGFGVSIGTGPIGWFPLGPRDVYCPPYRVSHNYFTQVNVTNINNVYVDRPTINNYYNNTHDGRGDPRFKPYYMYRDDPRAGTATSHDRFVGARPVGRDHEAFDRAGLDRAPVNFRSPAQPTQASLGPDSGSGRGFGHGEAPPTAVFSKPLIAHRAPPPAPASFAARQPVIAGNGGQPLAPDQLRQLARDRPPPAVRDRSPAFANQPGNEAQPSARFGGDGPRGNAPLSRPDFEGGRMRNGGPPANAAEAGAGANGGAFGSAQPQPRPQRGQMPSSGFAPHENRGGFAGPGNGGGFDRAPSNRTDDGPGRGNGDFNRAPQMPAREPSQASRPQPSPFTQEAPPPQRPAFQDRPQVIQSRPQLQERPQFDQRPQQPTAQDRPQFQPRPQPQVQQSQPVQERPRFQERPQFQQPAAQPQPHFEAPRPQPQPAPQPHFEAPRMQAPAPAPHFEAPRPQPAPPAQPHAEQRGSGHEHEDRR